MRLRQGVLVAEDLDAAVAALRDTFALGEPYPDPGVAVFGLRNAVLPLGNDFLEVVSPVRDDAPAARYRARQGGDGGYMVMLQSDDLAADRRRLDRLGIRIVWTGELEDIAGLHLHPKDTGGALLSLDQPRPAESWRWAGPGWQERSCTDVVRGLAAAELASPEPGRLATRWAEILGRPERGGEILLEKGSLRFVPGPAERLVGLDLHASDPGRAGEEHDLLGVRMRLI
jgi:hypothetical protein